MRLALGLLFLLAPGCVLAWEPYKTDVVQKTSATTTDALDHLVPVDQKMAEDSYLIQFIQEPALAYQYLHLTLSRDEPSGKFYLHSWSEWRKETETRPSNLVLGPSLKVQFPVDMAAGVYAMWVNALLEVRYDRQYSGGPDGRTDLFSVYIKGRGYLHGTTWSPAKDLPPKWMEDSALALVQYTRDKDEVACRKKLADLRNKLFAYLAANGKH